MAEGGREAERTDLSSPDYEGDEEPKVGTVTAEAAGSGRRNKREADRVPPGENNTEGEERDQDRFWLPERVKNALQKSRNFDEFRKARPFRFLHMFSGEADQLGASIKREAQRARLETYVEALDRKKDKEINLADTKVYDEIDKSVEGGEWDGFHSGFPCASFSRVRWRDSPGGPMPVRSAAHIYGLPGNTPSQQKEADEGTLMATRSAWLHKKQVVACQKRGVPEVSTLENPPGAKDSGSAWDLPELLQVVQETKSSTVEFNTCAYQTKLRKRWFKPARWTGKLETLGSLAKVCKCPAWVEHVPLMGKQKTEAAGAYPEEPTDAVAKKIVETWKRVLNLEWLRYQFKMKSNLINKLQASNPMARERREETEAGL